MSTRKRQFRRKKFPSRSTQIMTSVARREAKKVLKQNVEMKSFDGRVAIRPISNAGEVIRLWVNFSTSTAISQGPADNQYLGERVHTKFIDLRAQCIVGDDTNIVTFVIFQTKGLFTPIGGDMSNVFQFTLNDSAPLSMPDRAFSDRFRILARRTIAVDSVGRQNVVAHMKVKGKKLRPTDFNNAIGGPEDGDLYLGVISDSGAATDPTWNAQWRIYYTDA